MTNPTTLTAGIDVAKAKLDIAIHGQKRTTVAQTTPDGWRTIAAQLTREGFGRAARDLPIQRTTCAQTRPDRGMIAIERAGVT